MPLRVDSGGDLTAVTPQVKPLMMNTDATQIQPYPPSGGGSAGTFDSREDNATASISFALGSKGLLPVSVLHAMAKIVFDDSTTRLSGNVPQECTNFRNENRGPSCTTTTTDGGTGPLMILPQEGTVIHYAVSRSLHFLSNRKALVGEALI